MVKRALASLALLLAACATAPAPAPAPELVTQCDSGRPLLNSVLWVQSAAEYRAAATQTYNVARAMLDAALADKSWSAEPTDPDNDPSQPAAVILDLDETAWLNRPFESRMVREGKTYDEKEWKAWVAESAAEAVPGAAEFLAYANSRGVTPFYVTNRTQEEKPAGVVNLQKLGYPLLDGAANVLFRGDQDPSKGSDKTPRRTWVASRYRVLLLLGDDLNDFMAARDKTTAERDALIASTQRNWGTMWLIVPNPMYGSWERPYTSGTSDPCVQVQRKLDALDEKRP